MKRKPSAPDGPLPDLRTETFASPSLGQERRYNLLLPVGYETQADQRYPVLYLLHGKTGDHADWAAKAPHLREHIGATPWIVVMPDGGVDGWYTDWADGANGYEGQIIRDLIPHVDETYRTLARREGRALIGLSMGGYGALKLGPKHPDLFAATASHSGALTFARDDGEDSRKVFGTDAESHRRRRENDLFRLADNLLEPGGSWRGPALYFDCGAADFLYGANIRFKNWLREIGAPYEYHEYPGGHTWEYWDTYVPYAMDFALRHLADGAG